MGNGLEHMGVDGAESGADDDVGAPTEGDGGVAPVVDGSRGVDDDRQVDPVSSDGLGGGGPLDGDPDHAVDACKPPVSLEDVEVSGESGVGAASDHEGGPPVHYSNLFPRSGPGDPSGDVLVDGPVDGVVSNDPNGTIDAVVAARTSVAASSESVDDPVANGAWYVMPIVDDHGPAIVSVDDDVVVHPVHLVSPRAPPVYHPPLTLAVTAST